MTLHGKPLTDAQRAEIARAVQANKNLRGIYHSNERIDAPSISAPPSPLRGTGRDRRMKGSMK